METYVVWDNDEQAFVESVGPYGVFRTPNLDSAMQFDHVLKARTCANALPNGVVLRWL